MHDFIRHTALAVGFDDCGIANADALTEDAIFMRSWLEQGKHGEMKYLERHFDKRIDPRILVPGCKSVVVVLMNHYPKKQQAEELPKIAKYAYSKVDYHYVLKKKLNQLEAIIIDEYGEDCVSKDHQHSFVDTAPILEKTWAEKAGLGWIGRHTQLITPQFGSYVFIGILLLNVEVKPAKKLIPFRCGTCTKCIEACPTQALEGHGMDARKCISYLTLEAKSTIDDELKSKLSGWISGCDICNDVCPWNVRFAKPHQHKELKAEEAVLQLTSEDWQVMTEQEFREKFKYSAIQRAGLKRIQQKI